MSFILKITRSLLDFFGYSNLFLAIAVFCSTFQGCLIFENYREPCYYFSILNFVAAFVLYNFQRIYQSALATADVRLLWYRKNRKWIFTITFLLIISFHETIWKAFLNYPRGIIMYCVSAVISLLYFLPPFNLRKKKNMKQFVIAFIWVMVCVVIPFLFYDNSYSGFSKFGVREWLYVIAQFCLISALCIPFDIRDITKDKNEETNSMPVSLGINTSKLIAFVIMLVYFGLAFFMNAPNLIIVRGMILILATLVIYFSNENRHRYYFIYLTDGIIILQTVLLAYLL